MQWIQAKTGEEQAAGDEGGGYTSEEEDEEEEEEVKKSRKVLKARLHEKTEQTRGSDLEDSDSDTEFGGCNKFAVLSGE